MKLQYIHWYRGFAMIHIVLWHSFYAGIPFDSFWEKFFRALMNNGTTFFVFISGFLFAYLANRYEYKDYLVKKFKYVILPYFIVSIPALVWRFSQFQAGELPVDDVPAEVIHNAALFFGWTMVTGFHYGPLWFIPYVALIFLLAPLFYRIANSRHILFYLLPLLLLSIFTFRPLHNLQPLYNLTHFAGFYVLGIAACRLRDWSWLSHKAVICGLVLGVLSLILLECQTDQTTLNFQNTVLQGHLLLNLNALQKIIFCVLMMSLLKIIQEKSLMPESLGRTFNLVAEYSFGIFFVHGYFLMVLQKVFAHLALPEQGFIYLGVSLLQFAIVMTASMVVILFSKKLLKDNSRIFVGA